MATATTVSTASGRFFLSENEFGLIDEFSEHISHCDKECYEDEYFLN